MDWAYIAAATLVIVFAWLGVLLTLATLPGTWLAAIVAIACWRWQPEMLGWWSIGSVLGLCVLGEIAEMVSGGVGAAKAGGGRASIVGGLVGGLAGALLGTVFLPIPIVGTVVGAVLGGGLGAGIGARGVTGKTWGESVTVAKGAAVGRLLSVFVKGFIAAVIAVTLTAAVFV